MDNSKHIKILKKENSPAFGCTEPVAIALAVSKAAEVLGELPTEINLCISKNIYKNANSVTIPSTSLTGSKAAAALGAVICNSSKGLDIFSQINKQKIIEAKRFISERKISLSISNAPENLYIMAECSSISSTSKVIIKNHHDKIVSIEKDGKSIFAENKFNNSISDTHLYIDEIFSFIKQVNIESLDFLEKSLEMNLEIAMEGITKGNSFAGACLLSSETNQDSNLAVTTLAAAACEQRMSGSKLPVMTLAGSGNQGVTSILPVYSYSKKLGCSKEKMIRAMALSQLITIHIKQKMGRLSTICGCAVAAATGSSCAITYMLGGGIYEINKAINNMIANLSGLICDGAKPSCALKISTALCGAEQCALAAVKSDFCVKNTGIIGNSAEESINNLSRISKEAMDKTEDIMLDIIMKNNNK